MPQQHSAEMVLYYADSFSSISLLFYGFNITECLCPGPGQKREYEFHSSFSFLFYILFSFFTLPLVTVLEEIICFFNLSSCQFSMPLIIPVTLSSLPPFLQHSFGDGVTSTHRSLKH